MTEMQINYAKYLEAARNNREMEQIAARQAAAQEKNAESNRIQAYASATSAQAAMMNAESNAQNARSNAIMADAHMISALATKAYNEAMASINYSKMEHEFDSRNRELTLEAERFAWESGAKWQSSVGLELRKMENTLEVAKTQGRTQTRNTILNNVHDSLTTVSTNINKTVNNLITQGGTIANTIVNNVTKPGFILRSAK